MVDPKAGGNESSTPDNRSWMDKLLQSVPWRLLVLVVGVAGGTALTIKYIDDLVEGRVKAAAQLEVQAQIQKDTNADRWHRAELDARESQERAQAVNQRTITALQLAQQRGEDATRAANELLSKADQINKVVDIARLGTLIDSQLAKSDFRDAVVSRVLPKGAVMVFNLSDGCPVGWLPFDQAGGRVVIGAGPTTNLSEGGRPLSSYVVGATGGEGQHTITVSEMPPHRHATSLAAEDPPARAGVEYGITPRPLKGIAGSAYTAAFPGAYTSTEGLGQPFKNMPPYVALFHCTKL